MNEEQVHYDIQNVVLNGKFIVDDKIDTDALKAVMEGSYKNEGFPALVYKEKGNSSTILLFNSGAFICTGNKSVESGEQFIKSFMKKISDKGIKIQSVDYHIVNIVATGDLMSMIDLEAAALELKNVQYEPEVFPGIIYRPDPMPNNGIAPVFLLFKKGKFVCTKLKDVKMIKKWIEYTNSVLSSNNLYLENKFS